MKTIGEQMNELEEAYATLMVQFHDYQMNQLDIIKRFHELNKRINEQESKR